VIGLPDAILVIDPDPATAEALREPAREAAVAGRVDHAATLAEGRAILAECPYALVVLSLSTPDAGGVAALERIRALDPEVPVVVTTPSDDRELALAAIQHGAQDCTLAEDLRGRSAVRILRHAVERQRIMLELHEARERHQYLATHDPLTGVPNRTLFFDRLAQAIAGAVRYGKTLAILFVDLDEFKGINDARGHEAGDAVLQEVARRIASIVRRSDTVARIGGDEFTVILSQIGKPDDAATVARNMLDQIAAPLPVDGAELRVHASIGIAIHPRDGERADTLVRNADTAMYVAKKQGGNRHAFYERRMRHEG
jgi:diguanylate cyclase (GGDEF)-like protein